MTEKSRSALLADLAADITTNGAGAITGAKLLARMTDIVDSSHLDQDAYVKTEVDALVAAAAAGVAKRATVRAATTGNITIATALNAGDVVDGVTLANGDAVLVKSQTAPAENGIIVVGAAPARSSEFDTYNEHPGALIVVQEGAVNADTLWYCTSNVGGTLNTTAINFAKVDVDIAALINAATNKDTPIDADKFGFWDSVSGLLRQASWANIKATLKAYFDTIYSPITGGRERLTANRTYYVRTDGSNSNDGLTDSSGGAFATVAKAWDVVCDTLDLAGFSVTIQVGDGTYTGLAIDSNKGAVGGQGMGQITIRGNSTTPANVIFTRTSGDLFKFGGDGTSRASVTLRDFEMRTVTSGICLTVFGASVAINNVRFGTCATWHMWIAHGAWLEAKGNYSVSGGALVHLLCESNAVAALHGRTITYSNSPAFTNWNISAFGSGAIYANGMTFTNGGTVTGKRYVVEKNGFIETASGGANYFPGNSAGTFATGGQYV